MKIRLLGILLCSLCITFNLHAQSADSTPNEKKPEETAGKPKDDVKTEGQKKPEDDTKKLEDDKKKAEDDKKKAEDEKKKPEEPKSPHTFAANVSLVSDYRFRGISQTMRQPAIQGGFDYSHKNGLYLGTWASNVDGTCNFYNNTSMEWDFYGGYKAKLLPCLYPDLKYTVGVICYYYPGGETFSKESVRYNTVEYLVEFTYKWIDVKFSQTLSNYFGICNRNPPFNWDTNLPDHPNGSSRGSISIEGSFTYELCKNLSLLLYAGRQHVRHYHHLSCTHWRITLTKTFDWVNAFVTYVGTDANHDYFDVPDHTFHSRKRSLGAQGFVFGISKSL